RSDLRLGLLAEVAGRTRIDRDVARASQLQAAVFGAKVGIRRAGSAQPSAFDQLRHDRLHNRRLSQLGKRSSARSRRVEGGENLLLHRIHDREYLYPNSSPGGRMKAAPSEDQNSWRM